MNNTKIWLVAGNLVALLCCIGLFAWIYVLNQEIKSLELSARTLKTEIGSKKYGTGTGADAIWDSYSVWDFVYMLRKTMAFDKMIEPRRSDTSAEQIMMLSLEIDHRQLKTDLGFFEPSSALSGEVRVNCYMNRAGQISCRAPR